MFSRSIIACLLFFELLYCGHPITIDGLFNDWVNVPVAYNDPQADGMSLDFSQLKVTYDNEFLFFYFSLHNMEMLLQNGNAVHLYIDADNDSTTGQPFYSIGAELAWVFGQRSGNHYVNDGIIPVGQNDLNFRSAPNVTSQEFEFCISRNTWAFESGNSTVLVNGKIVIAEAPPNADIMPNEGGGIPFFIGEDYIPEPTPISFSKRNNTDIRLVTQNVLNSNLVNPVLENHFRRIYQVLNPDIVCLQEMYENTNQILSLFNSWFQNESWYISNQFRDNIIVSKYPIIEQSFYTTSERTMVALLDTEEDLGSKLLIFNSHLACCDNNESRQTDADEFVKKWREWTQNGNGPFIIPDHVPFVHVGDFNLVGDRQQLITFSEGDIADEQSYGGDFPLDWDGTAITDLFSRHSHKRMGYTWRNDASSFSPGKLDYILYSDSQIDTANHFVLNTLTMDSLSLISYGLDSLDSYFSSDHSPRVFDISIPVTNGIGNSDLPETFRISAPFPNPFNMQSMMEIQLFTKQLLLISLYDINGKKVKELIHRVFEQGKYNIEINGQGLSSGIYFVTVYGTHEYKTFKLVLMK